MPDFVGLPPPQVVQVDDDYSDVVDSKDYVTPGEDGTRKIYCTNASDSALDEEEPSDEEPDLPYCQPYGRANGVTGQSSPDASVLSQWVSGRGSCTYILSRRAPL